MTLKDSFATDADTVFCNPDDFAESVTYYPHQYYGESARPDRTINAVVIRESITVFGEDGGETVLPIWQVHVVNDSTNGITSDELDLGGDKIGFPPRDNEAAESKSVTRLISHDPGLLVLECR